MFYDPAGHHRGRPPTVLLDDVADTRVPAVLAPAGRLVGHEVILAEALHACLDIRYADTGSLDTGSLGTGSLGKAGGPRSAGRPSQRDTVVLPIPAGRQRVIAEAVDRHARTVAAAVIGVADSLDHDLDQLRRRLPGLYQPSRSERLVLAGRVLAAVAHEGMVRRSGRDFYCHPDEVASILTAAWRRQGRAEDDPRLQISRFLSYCHDAFEDILDPVGAYLSELPVIVSPRVALAVLQQLAVPDAADVARVLLLMTRTKATDGSRMPYLDYLQRGIAEGGAYFALTKAGDIHHNLTIEPEDIDPADPRAAARYDKRELYRTAANLLRGAADHHDDDLAWAVHTTFAIQPAEFRPALRTDSSSVRQLASAVRDRVLRS